MADNLTLNPARHGETVAAEDLSGVKYIKIAGTSALNTEFQESVQAITARAITEERLIAEGYYNGRSIVAKFGRNGDVDTATVPEDVCGNGGTYTGFPTGAAEEFQVVSTNAGDTGVLTFTYLASFTATEWQTANVTLNGTTPVNTGITGVRCHTMRYDSGSDTAFNLGDITLRHAVTTANVFATIPIGKSQSNNAAYTVPFGSRGFIKRLFVRENSNQDGFVEGALWLREFGASPRLRRPFACAAQSPFEEMIYGGIELHALTDIHVRVLSASVNNMAVVAGYDIIVVPN